MSVRTPRLHECLVLAAALLGAAIAWAGTARAVPPPNLGVSIWTANVHAFRERDGSAGQYKKRWDLSGLPRYVPRRQLNGTLRVWGLSYLQDGPLGKNWADAFQKYEPGLKIAYHVPTGAVAVAALATGVADIGVNYKATLTDRLDFEQVFHHPVTEVTVATGSLDVYGWGPAGMIVVNKANPLAQISVAQLDGVFGTARNGGYEGTVWHTEYPYSRGAQGNIRTWGQLGLTGKWADKRIEVCGQNLLSGAMYQFSDEVLGGSMQFVGDYQAYTNYLTTGGKVYNWSVQVRSQVEHDPYAICYASPKLCPLISESWPSSRAPVAPMCRGLWRRCATTPTRSRTISISSSIAIPASRSIHGSRSSCASSSANRDRSACNVMGGICR